MIGMTSPYASTLSTSDTAAPDGTKLWLPCRYGDVMTAHMPYDKQLLMTACSLVTKDCCYTGCLRMDCKVWCSLQSLSCSVTVQPGRQLTATFKWCHIVCTSLQDCKDITKCFMPACQGVHTSIKLDRHETFSDHPSEVGPGNELLANIAAFGETDCIQTIQVVLQGDSMTCSSTGCTV